MLIFTDEHQEDNIISVDNTYSPPRNAAPEQYAELTSSNTSSREGELPSSKLSLQESQLTSPKPSSREGGLVSSEDLLVEDWTVESQEDNEPDYIVESVKAEQEDVEAVFPVAGKFTLSVQYFVSVTHFLCQSCFNSVANLLETAKYFKTNCSNSVKFTALLELKVC